MSFKAEREKAGLSQKDVAKELGINQSTICLWEIGKTMPRANLLLKLAKFYGCSVEQLTSDDPGESSANIQPSAEIPKEQMSQDQWLRHLADSIKAESEARKKQLNV